VGDYHLSQINTIIQGKSQTENSPCLNAVVSMPAIWDWVTTRRPRLFQSVTLKKWIWGIIIGLRYPGDMLLLTSRLPVMTGPGVDQFFDGIIDTGDLLRFGDVWLEKTCNFENLYWRCGTGQLWWSWFLRFYLFSRLLADRRYWSSWPGANGIRNLSPRG